MRRIASSLLLALLVLWSRGGPSVVFVHGHADGDRPHVHLDHHVDHAPDDRRHGPHEHFDPSRTEHSLAETPETVSLREARRLSFEHAHETEWLCPLSPVVPQAAAVSTVSGCARPEPPLLANRFVPRPSSRAPPAGPDSGTFRV